MALDKYRTAAKRSAWYDDDDDENPNYNPFRKVRAHSKAIARNGTDAVRIKTNRSENRLTSQIEADRRSKGSPEQDTQPLHAQTLPASPGSDERDKFQYPKPNTAEGETQAPEAKKDVSEDSGLATSDTVLEKPTPTSDSPITHQDDKKPGLRRRLLGRFHGHKSEDAVDAEAGEGDSEYSQKNNKPKYTVSSQIRATILNSYINILLVFVPVGIAVNYAGVSKVAVFVINFIAIIPLAAMLSYATEEIALHVGETLGGLLNATFGNAVELIVSIIALVKKEVDIVQESLIGSMLSNLLLVMGMCFFFGGLTRVKQHFNQTVAQTASSLLALAIASLIIPAAFQRWSDGSDSLKEPLITKLSRGTAILLLIVYACYLLFQLKTHIEIYNAPSPKVAKRKKKVEQGAANKLVASMGAEASATAGGQVAQEKPTRDPPKTDKDGKEIPQDEDEREQPQLLAWVALLTLAVSTAFVGVCAEFMVDSIDAITAGGAVSRTFVGLILLPIVGNAAEHATAVTVACKDKMDLAIGVAVGSSMQIALLVIPFTVVLGWILGNEQMNLAFDGFQITVLFVSILLVNYLIQDGESHWLEGVLLQTLYIIIALAAWFYPPDNPATNNAKRAMMGS